MSNLHINLRLDLPPDWEDQTVYTFAGPSTGDTRPFLTMMVDREVTDELEAYARERIDSTLNTLQGIEVLKEESKTMPNGNRAYEAVFKWIPADGQVVFRKQVYVLIGETIYCFAINLSKKTIKTVGVEVDSIINSLVAGDQGTE
jgi:hypothetical protein